MPELPVVQALAERLDAMFLGAALAGADTLGFSALKTVAPLPEELVGRALAGVGRRGKFLVFDFDGPRLLIHLYQGGRVVIEDPPLQTRPKGRGGAGVVRIRFTNKPAILVKEYGTERKARWWVMAAGDDGPLDALGPEADSAAFADFICNSDDNRRVHTILRDQHSVAGVGRGLADDTLWAARLSPTVQLRRLEPAQREALVDALRYCLDRALELERRRDGGLPPKLSENFLVHARFGQACPACEGTLARVSYESMEVVYCPTCQTGGKPLADRRLSRLLK